MDVAKIETPRRAFVFMATVRMMRIKPMIAAMINLKPWAEI